jgi:membrane protein insertase Oxa1/YidC/SpoIIIJ
VFGVLRLDFNLPETMSYAYEKFAGFDVTALKTDFFGFEVPTMVSEAVSAGDYSYVILPVLVGVSQYYALKLAMKKNHEKVLDITPDESKEPDKMKEMEKMSGMMTKFLPVFVGVMSYTFQAGLSIYWISSTVFGIFQQIAINKSWERRKKGLDVASGGRSAVKAEVVDVGGSKKEKMGDVNVEVIKLDK